MKRNLLFEILQERKQACTYPTLEEMGITHELLKKIHQWSKEKTTYGQLPDYIPELSRVNPDQSALAIGDLYDTILTIDDISSEPISIQSVIKPFLYVFALQHGCLAEDLSFIEAPGTPFNADPILQPQAHRLRPGHPLNNAGAISTAGSIESFDEFLEFMCRITGNSNLKVLAPVYQSEMDTNANNRAIAFRLVATDRFHSLNEGEKALEAYTKACAIGVTVKDMAQAGIVLARGGLLNDNQLVEQNHAVRAINAMNSFGLYEHTAELSLLAAGTRALSCKSGVGGLILNIDPGRGAFCTYGPRLDSSGNSVYGTHALILLNHILSHPNAMRLSPEEIHRCLSQNNIRHGMV